MSTIKRVVKLSGRAVTRVIISAVISGVIQVGEDFIIKNSAERRDGSHPFRTGGFMGEMPEMRGYSL